MGMIGDVTPLTLERLGTLNVTASLAYTHAAPNSETVYIFEKLSSKDQSPRINRLIKKPGDRLERFKYDPGLNKDEPPVGAMNRTQFNDNFNLTHVTRAVKAKMALVDVHAPLIHDRRVVDSRALFGDPLTMDLSLT